MKVLLIIVILVVSGGAYPRHKRSPKKETFVEFLLRKRLAFFCKDGRFSSHKIYLITPEIRKIPTLPVHTLTTLDNKNAKKLFQKITQQKRFVPLSYEVQVVKEGEPAPVPIPRQRIEVKIPSSGRSNGRSNGRSSGGSTPRLPPGVTLQRVQHWGPSE